MNFLDGNLKSDVRPHAINSFDIETTGRRNEFYMGSIVGDSTRGGEPEVYYDKVEMLDALLSRRFREGYIYAHNLEFDLMGVIDRPYLEGRDIDYEIFHNGANIIYGKFRDDSSHLWEFRDSLNIDPTMSVKRMGEIVGLEKLDMDFEANDVTDYEDSYIEEYNVRDSRIAYKFLKWFQSEINSLGGNMEITSAKTAMNFYRRNYLPKPIQQPRKDILEKSYEGYYGGRVSPFVKGHIDGPIYAWDIASLYPHCMREQEFPDTNSIRFVRDNGKYGPEEKEAHVWDYEGMSQVTLEAPNMHKPIVPVRTEEKLLFPTGLIPNTWVCHNELRFALKRGYKIRNISEQIYTERSMGLFDGYVSEMFGKRLKYSYEGNRTERVVKLLMNALYGKFGQRIENEDGGTYKPLQECEIEELDGKKVVGDWVVENESSDYTPSYINPLIAAYVTSRGRMELYRWIERAENQGGEVYYTDTDSIYTDIKLDVNSRKQLGDMDFEGEFSDMWVFGPKMYITMPADGDEPKITAKGVPYGEMRNLWDTIQNGGDEIEYTKIAGMREAIRRGHKPNEVIEHSRSVSLQEPTKRVHRTPEANLRDERVDTDPVHIKDYEKDEGVTLRGEGVAL